MSSPSAVDAAPRVAFVLHRFPHLTETFIVRDITELHRRGTDITLFPLLPPTHAVTTSEARRLLPLARYGPLLSARILRSQLHFLRRKPLRYLRALCELVRQAWREPAVLARALVLFPKGVDIARQVEADGIDHVHANFVWLEALTADVVRNLTGVPFSVRPHAFGLFSRNRRSVRAQLRKAAHVVTISEYHRRYAADAMGVDPAEVGVVHLGIDTERFSPEDRPSDRHPIRIVSIGRGVEKKGHRYLVEACGILTSRDVEFACDILVGGGGAERLALQSLVDELGLGAHVSLLDARDEEGVLELYRSADIFSLACVIAGDGDRDGMPNVLLEAMACGLPVVTTPVAGIAELVVDQDNGLLVPQRDAGRLADALERLIKDPQLRARLGRSGREAVADDFDIRQTAAQLLDVFTRHAASRDVGDGRRAGRVGGIE